MKRAKRRDDKLVAVTVTLLIPLPRREIARGGAVETAREIVRELPVEVGGVRVKVVA